MTEEIESLESELPEQEVETETEVDETPVTETDEEGGGETDTDAGDHEEGQALWMLSDEKLNEVEQGETIPVAAHVAKRKALQGRLSEKDDEIANLRAKVQAYESGATPAPVSDEQLIRPKEDDFDTYEEYEKAIDDYEEKRIKQRYRRIESESAQAAQLEKRKAVLSDAVNAHFDRAAKLIESTPGMKPEVYKQADMAFRESIEAISPGNGDQVADVLIEAMGDGSEKVGYHVGLNKTARAEFQSLLADKNGGLLKACVYLGRKLESADRKVSKKPKSNAPAPAPSARGEESGNAEAKFRRQYDKAKKSGDLSKVFEIKGKAKAAGIDTKSWNR